MIGKLDYTGKRRGSISYFALQSMMKVIIEFKTISGITGAIGLMNSVPTYSMDLAVFSYVRPRS